MSDAIPNRVLRRRGRPKKDRHEDKTESEKLMANKEEKPVEEKPPIAAKKKEVKEVDDAVSKAHRNRVEQAKIYHSKKQNKNERVASEELVEVGNKVVKKVKLKNGKVYSYYVGTKKQFGKMVLS